MNYLEQYEHYKKYKVQAESIDDFLRRYTNYNSLSVQVAPHEVRLKSYMDEYQKCGFCYMTKFMSITGQPVTYYPNEMESEGE